MSSPIGADGTIYRAYVLSSQCSYVGIPAGGQTSPSDTGGQTKYVGPPYKVRATCLCRYGTPAYFVVTDRPNPYVRRSVAVYAPRFQVPCKKS